MRFIREISYRWKGRVRKFRPSCDFCDSRLIYRASGSGCNPIYWYTRCGLCGRRDGWSKRRFRMH
jgi:hypothetical protein